MHPGKKQITAFGLLLLVALPLFFSAGIFIKQKFIQHQRRQRFKTELLQTISVAAEKLVWVKPGKEIQINGKLFDVKSFKTTGSNIVLTGFFDHKEDKLVKQIKGLNQQKNDSNGPTNQLAVKFLFYPGYKELTSFSIENSWQIIARQFRVYAEAISCISYPAAAPPPKYC